MFFFIKFSVIFVKHLINQTERQTSLMPRNILSDDRVSSSHTVTSPKKFTKRLKEEIRVSNDSWLRILPFLDHFQLGLILALLSVRFDALVDKYFSLKTKLTCRRLTTLYKDSKTEEPQLAHVDLPKQLLPNKIRFDRLEIHYIDHSVIAFLRRNKQIFDKGTNLFLSLIDEGTIWEVVAREVWPIFEPGIRHLAFRWGKCLDKLRRLISPTILTDLNPNTIDSGQLFPNLIGPNNWESATAGQALFIWLHTPSADGRAKRLAFRDLNGPRSVQWVENFVDAFDRATTPATFVIVHGTVAKADIEQFEMINEQTQESLTLIERSRLKNKKVWVMKRGPIGEGTDQQQLKEQSADDVHNVSIMLWDKKSIGCTPARPVAIRRSESALSNGLAARTYVHGPATI